MGKRAFAAVLKAFADEAAAAFGFLADDLGFAGPVCQDVVLPTVTFVGPTVRYRISFDLMEMAVDTRMEFDTESSTLVAELGNLVRATGLGAPNHVRHTAHSLKALRRALESQAGYIRRLQPKINSETVAEVMRTANAREWRA